MKPQRSAFWPCLLVAFVLSFAIVSLILAIVSAARATVSSTVSSVTALGNGSATVFNFPFIGVSPNDIVVAYIDASGNRTVLGVTTYTLSLNAPPAGQIWGVGGTVTYPLIGSPIAFGTKLTITRTVPLLQTTPLRNQGSFFPQAVEQAIDLVVLEFQGIGTQVARALQVPVDDICNPLGFLPEAPQRANQLIGFDSTGCNPIAAQPSNALVSAAMQPVVDAPTIAAAQALLGITSNAIPVGTEVDWPGFTAPTNWQIENGAAISRTTYSALLAVIAPVVPCTVTMGSSTITGIGSSTLPGLGTGYIIESPGSGAIATGQTIASVGGTSITIAGGNASANATQCQVFPYGTAQDGTFNVPNSTGVVYAGLDIGNANLSPTYCTGNPAYLNAICGSQSHTLTQAELPVFSQTPTFTGTPATWNVTGYSNLLSTNNVSPLYGAGAFGSQVNSGLAVTVTPSGTVSAITFGSGNAHSVLQPTRIRNKIIFAGVP
jgi:microcystin-dependent protein